MTPNIFSRQLVGTNHANRMPRSGAAALGHLLFRTTSEAGQILSMADSLGRTLQPLVYSSDAAPCLHDACMAAGVGDYLRIVFFPTSRSQALSERLTCVNH